MKKNLRYWRIITLDSRDLNPVRTKDLFYFNSGNYKTDVKRAKNCLLTGRKFVYLSKIKYNTFGEALERAK